jgi:hypothetical protein
MTERSAKTNDRNRVAANMADSVWNRRMDLLGARRGTWDDLRRLLPLRPTRRGRA